MSIKGKYTKHSLKTLEKITGEKLTLGRLIWAIRQSDEITQVAFAKKLAISKQQLCDIEHNRKPISPKLAAAYAERLGYPKDQFIRLCLQEMVDKAKLNIVVEANSTPLRHKNFSLRVASS